MAQNNFVWLSFLFAIIFLQGIVCSVPEQIHVSLGGEWNGCVLTCVMIIGVFGSLRKQLRGHMDHLQWMQQRIQTGLWFPTRFFDQLCRSSVHFVRWWWPCRSSSLHLPCSLGWLGPFHPILWVFSTVSNESFELVVRLPMRQWSWTKWYLVLDHHWLWFRLVAPLIGLWRLGPDQWTVCTQNQGASEQRESGRYTPHWYECENSVNIVCHTRYGCRGFRLRFAYGNIVMHLLKPDAWCSPWRRTLCLAMLSWITFNHLLQKYRTKLVPEIMSRHSE